MIGNAGGVIANVMSIELHWVSIPRESRIKLLHPKCW